MRFFFTATSATSATSTTSTTSTTSRAVAHSRASRRMLDQAFERHGLARPRVQIESNVLNMVLPIVEKTHLLGFVTRYNLRSGRTRLREVELPETTMKRRLGLTYRKAGYISPVMQRISALVREKGASLLDGQG